MLLILFCLCHSDVAHFVFVIPMLLFFVFVIPMLLILFCLCCPMLLILFCLSQYDFAHFIFCCTHVHIVPVHYNFLVSFLSLLPLVFFSYCFTGYLLHKCKTTIANTFCTINE